MNDEKRKEIVFASMQLYDKGRSLLEIMESAELFNPKNQFASKLAYKTIDMFSSLLIAVDKAGGCPEGFNPNNLKSMDVVDLISHLCSNNIQFIYKYKKPKGKRK